MSNRQISPELLREMADNVKIIQNFSENSNFSPGLINASITPTGANDRKFDKPLISAAISVIVFLLILIGVNLYDNVDQKVIVIVFIVCLVVGGICVMSVQAKFEELSLTLIAGFVLLIALVVGCGLFTPKEAVTEAADYMKGKNGKEER